MFYYVVEIMYYFYNNPNFRFLKKKKKIELFYIHFYTSKYLVRNLLVIMIQTRYTNISSINGHDEFN